MEVSADYSNRIRINSGMAGQINTCTVVFCAHRHPHLGTKQCLLLQSKPTTHPDAVLVKTDVKKAERVRETIYLPRNIHNKQGVYNRTDQL